MEKSNKKNSVRADEIVDGEIMFPIRQVKPFGPDEQALAELLKDRLELEECVKNETN